MNKSKDRLVYVLIALLTPLFLVAPVFGQSIPTANPGNEGIGMQGNLQQPPPTDSPTISLPADGAVFTELPVTVTGLCTDTLLVRVFKNNVFGGSAICDGGSYELQIDLFPGQNVITARQYDDLDQASPESDARTVTFSIPEPTVPGSPDQITQRITLTTNFARRGANPGQDLTWPLTLSGGRGPYAISIDWGDGKNDLSTQPSPDTFEVKHAYEKPGVYKVLIKATDAAGESAFLQLVGIGNGDIGTAGAGETEGPTVVRTKVLWQPVVVTLPLLLSSFWLGKRYQLKRVRYRMKNRIVPIDK